jgi:S-DNA-T family DNA segregation ATPase FtsK/SpoIIIE
VVKIVTEVIKANLQLKIALKVTSNKNSQIILDEGGAEKLIGRGDLLVGGSIGIERLQCPLATTADIEKVQKRG